MKIMWARFNDKFDSQWVAVGVGWIVLSSYGLVMLLFPWHSWIVLILGAIPFIFFVMGALILFREFQLYKQEKRKPSAEHSASSRVK